MCWAGAPLALGSTETHNNKLRRAVCAFSAERQKALSKMCVIVVRDRHLNLVMKMGMDMLVRMVFLLGCCYSTHGSGALALATCYTTCFHLLFCLLGSGSKLISEIRWCSMWLLQMHEDTEAPSTRSSVARPEDAIGGVHKKR